ncbi:MAG: flagellar hook-basal body complex protein FliE [Rhizobacter sp.]|nr:flagellar hook-basal body complex protein FliE [Rhizobacter sp.]
MEPTLARAIHADLASIANAAAGLGPTEGVSLAIGPPAAAHGASFTDSMRSALHRVDDGERHAAERMSAVDSGQSDDLVGAMLASQDASLSFSMLMQVRNKVMGAVEDLVKLPL